MLKRVIALSGWKGSGKDTVAEYLAKKYGYIRASFASRLKDLVSIQYSVSREFLDDQSRKELPLYNLPVIPTDDFTRLIQEQLQTELQSGYWTPRALAILEGSIKRAVLPNYWIHDIARMLKENKDSRFVISDLRFKSEADTLKLYVPEIVLVRINRFSTIETNSTSERDLDDYRFDKYIDNVGTQEELYETIDAELVDPSLIHSNVVSLSRKKG